MAEVSEVFEMATKQMEPDQDSWNQQERRHRRTARNRKIGALVVAAAIVVAAVVLILELRPGEDARTPAKSPTVAPAIASRPFFLDLRTGEETPLEDNLAGGLYYMASPTARGSSTARAVSAAAAGRT